jgi:hypothetical protein
MNKAESRCVNDLRTMCGKYTFLQPSPPINSSEISYNISSDMGSNHINRISLKKTSDILTYPSSNPYLPYKTLKQVVNGSQLSNSLNKQVIDSESSGTDETVHPIKYHAYSMNRRNHLNIQEPYNHVDNKSSNSIKDS